MPNASSSPELTVEALVRDVRSLLHILVSRDAPTRGDLESLQESASSVPLEEQVAFLRENGFIAVADDGVISVLGRGRAATKGSHDATLFSALTAWFAERLGSGELPRRPGAPDDAPLLFLDRYERGDAIGLGTLGTVYRARALGSHRAVAVKEVSHVFQFVTYLSRHELLSRLRAAVRAQASIEHPYVARVVEAAFDLPFPLIVTELCAGGSLRARMDRAHEDGSLALPLSFALGVAQQCAHALRALHAHGFVHGGVRPENVLFDARGNVRLTDVGVAAVTERAPHDSNAPVYVGGAQPSYAAPEVLRGDGSSPASDLYALGIVLHEMLTGEVPGRRTPLPGERDASVPRAVDDVIDRLTRDDVDARFPDAAAVLGALAPLLPSERATAGVLWLWEEDPLATATSTAPPREEPAAAAEPEPEPDADGDGDGRFDMSDDDYDDPLDVTQPSLSVRSPLDGED